MSRRDEFDNGHSKDYFRDNSKMDKAIFEDNPSTCSKCGASGSFSKLQEYKGKPHCSRCAEKDYDKG